MQILSHIYIQDQVQNTNKIFLIRFVKLASVNKINKFDTNNLLIKFPIKERKIFTHFMNVINIIFIEMIERDNPRYTEISRKELYIVPRSFRDDKNACTYDFSKVSPHLLTMR